MTTRTYTIEGSYGHLDPNPATILCAEMSNGGTWYCVEGSENVNFTYDFFDGLMPEGQNVEELVDFDCFNWTGSINGLEELVEAVEAQPSVSKPTAG